MSQFRFKDKKIDVFISKVILKLKFDKLLRRVFVLMFGKKCVMCNSRDILTVSHGSYNEHFCGKCNCSYSYSKKDGNIMIW